MEDCVVKTIWFLILIFVGLGGASFCASCFIIVHPLSVCLPGLEPIVEIFMKGLKFPHYCAERMMGVPVQKDHEFQQTHTGVPQQTNIDY